MYCLAKNKSNFWGVSLSLSELKSHNTVLKKHHKKIEVMPYVHKILHSLKRVAAKFCVVVIITTLCKFSNICNARDQRLSCWFVVRGMVISAASLISGYGSHLPMHCKAYGCSSALNGVQVARRRKGSGKGDARSGSDT